MKIQKTNLERFIKNVKLEIINNDMECVPVSKMLNDNEDILCECFLTHKTPYKTAKKIRAQY